MTEIDQDTAEIKQKIAEIWEGVIRLCSRVLKNADIYGYQLMHLPEDPNIFKLEKLLSHVVCPVLDSISSDSPLEPEEALKIDNMKQYTLHLRSIIRAIEAADKDGFERSVSILQAEPMIL